ncbi:hypothetical protein CASFOL_023740 [Castilleja foliolosa]|uniref:Uncharacterized protein n=1 Tax=Castilleja foliolosa TaxID=1961234 RepID=A0ABD3CLE4_9LAMI
MIKLGKMIELMEEYSLIMARMRDELHFRRVDFHFLRTLHSASTNSASLDSSSSFLMYF